PAPVAAAARDEDVTLEATPDGGAAKGKGKRDAGRGKKAADKPAEKVADKASDKGKATKGRDKAADKAPAAAPAAAAPARPATVADPSGQVRLHVGLGKQHSASAGDVRTFLAGFGIADAAQIGSVMLRDSHSYVKVPAALADQLVAKAHNKKHGTTKVTVEKA
nr:DbpA RNA binding domain-containing protein [Kofleriaceae bacterium]